MKKGVALPSMYVTVNYNSISTTSSSYDEAYLQCINPEGNNYKYYRLLPLASGQLDVEYGSIDEDTCAPRHIKEPYDSYLYWIRYYEKLSKGYVDETATFLHSKKVVEGKLKKATPTTANAILYQKLMAFAKKHVAEVLLQPKMITEAQVKKARKEFDLMCEMKTARGFNSHLTKLLGYSPRNIGNRALGRNSINDLLLPAMYSVDSKQADAIVEREKKLLLAMEAIVADDKMTATEKEESFKKHNILVFDANDEQKKEVLDLLPDGLKSNVSHIYRVKPLAQEKRMREYCKKNKITKIEKLWHGSVNENWASIIENSLMISSRVANGSMFGRGEYFAPSAHKSFNYTSFRGTTWARGRSDTGFMGLFACAYGNPYFVHSPGNYSQSTLKSAGYDCVHAKACNTGLRADEIVFYDEAALCLNYIVEFKAA
jgi:poly [ADP-ribose] polymerase